MEKRDTEGDRIFRVENIPRRGEKKDQNWNNNRRHEGISPRAFCRNGQKFCRSAQKCCFVGNFFPFSVRKWVILQKAERHEAQCREGNEGGDF